MVTSVCPPALADNKTKIEYTEATPQKKQKQVEYTEAVPQKKQKQIEYTDVTTQKKQKYDVTEISSNKKNTNTQDIISNENVVNKETNGTVGIPTTIADGETFITGTVYDMFDNKTVGKAVTVTLYAKGDLDNPLAQCETDNDGGFKFTGVSVGEYTLEFSCNIFFTKYQDVMISEGSEGYIINAIYMQEVGRDNCTVVDADTSAPLENVEVVLYLEGELITSTKTNENGIFSIDGIKRDYYDVMLTCQGYQTKMLEGWLFAAIPTGRTIEMQPSTGDDNPSGDDKGTNGTCGEHLTWILEDGTLTISGKGAMYDYTSLDDVPWNVNDVKKVIIEDGVTTVGNSAFYSCMNLTQVTLPNSLTEIRESAFGACVNLSEIIIPEGVTKIGDSAFHSCNNLEKVTIPESVTRIQECAFGWCSTIKDVYYAGDENQWKNIFIGEDNDFLTNATIHYNSKNTDPDNPDEDKEKITWNLDENGVLTISGKNAILSRDDLRGLQLENVKTIIINEGIAEIDAYAFSGCKNLKEIITPDSITSIGHRAFEDCSSLTEIKIPDNVTNIDSFAFSNCSSLKKVAMSDSVINIGSYAFSGCSNLTEITIPNSDVSIGEYAFQGCSNLIEIIIPGSVTNIGNRAFAGCNGLTKITILDGVTSIDSYAFYGCSNLTEITIPNSVASIGSYAFSHCRSLTEIIIPNSVISIGERAFNECNNLTDVYYTGTEDQWKTLMNNTDKDNDPLLKATVHFNSTGQDTPEQDSGKCGDNLTWTIKDGTLTISGTGDMYDYSFIFIQQNYAPWNGMPINTVVLQEGVTSIGNVAFNNCDNLTSITIPNSITRIGDGAFLNCIHLTDIYYDGSEDQWKDLINSNNAPPDGVTIHYNSTNIDDDKGHQDKLKMSYITEHKDYYNSSYSTDIVPMSSTTGLGFILDDIDDDFSNEIYKELSIGEKYVSAFSSLFSLNISSFIDVDWGNGNVSIKVPAIDLGSSEYTAILYQLMASDEVYNGILDSFSINYEKNLYDFGKLLSDNFLGLLEDINAEDKKQAMKTMQEAAKILKISDTNSEEFAKAYRDFEQIGNQYLDLQKTKSFLSEVSTIKSDMFDVLGYVNDELDSIAKAFQYACWAETYAETNKEFKEVLQAIAAEADQRGKELTIMDPSYGSDLSNPYSEANMCFGLSKSIKTFIKNMDDYTKDAQNTFVTQIIDKTGDSCFKIVSKFLSKKMNSTIGKTLYPPLAIINDTLSTGKTLIDSFTDIDEKYELALTVDSLDLITQFLVEVSNSYGSGLDMPIIDNFNLDNQFKRALKFDESIKMYKNAMLLSCDYGAKYEKIKIKHTAHKSQLVVDFLYAKDISECSTAINLLSLQKSDCHKIHCHFGDWEYDPSTDTIHFDGINLKVLTFTCPVDVYVKNDLGEQIAFLSNNGNSVAEGYENYCYTIESEEDPDDYIKVVIVPQSYEVTLQGSGNGKMNAYIANYSDNDNSIQELGAFYNISLTEDTKGYFVPSSTNINLEDLIINDDTQIAVTKPSIPEEPNKPDKPVTPSTPNKPDVPTTPDKPENPDTPEQQFTITFSGNGGMIDDETLKTILTSRDGKITNLPTPTRTGYTFDGWFTERYDGEEITAETIFTQDTTVYAQWTNNSSNNSSSGSGGGGSSSHRGSSSSSSKSTTSNQKAKVSCTAGGTVIANNDGTATITPNDGYKVFVISINGEKADIPSDGKLTNLKSEDIVMVRFDPISEISVTSVPSNNSNKFIDVPAGAWYYEAVNYVVEHNLFSGMSKTKFAPNDTMTRAMLMTVLARMDGQDVTGGTTWYEKGMNWAKQKQISDGTNPQSDITREQLAAMLYRYAGYPTTTGNLSQFSDNEQTSNYAKSALCWATEKGIISGKGNNILDPKGKATRAEVAAMLMRFCEMR